jgi:Xaa-Pro aminopeptidase
MPTETETQTQTSAGADPDAPLRAARRDRMFAAMAGAGLDALVLSRRDTIAYASGAARLWTAGTRPFSASCVVLAAGRSVHLLTTWDEGVPPEIPFDDLYGVTWNPAIMEQALRALPGLTDARRIGVDGLSVGFEHLTERLAPGAELVPADDLLQAVRTVKLPAEVDRLRAATAIAAAAVEAAGAAVTGGASPAEALAVALRTTADRGVTIPASAPVVAPSGPFVHVDVGILLDDYEGAQGRTVVAPSATAASSTTAADLDAVEQAQQRLLDACRPGATGADVRAAAGLTRWRVRGSGLGFEHPVITDIVGAGARLEEGMVLSVEVQVGDAHRRDLVIVGPAATTPLV